MKDYNNKEIYGDEDKKILHDIFEDEQVDEILTLHSQYDEPMKISKELSEKNKKLTKLND